MASKTTFLDGQKELNQILDQLPNNFSHKAISMAAAKAAAPIVTNAKRRLIQHAKGTDDGLSKVRFVARQIVAKRHTKGVPGARVKVMGGDVPVKGSRYGNWNIQGYAKLLGEGAYKTPNRKGKGAFKGFGNFIQQAADSKMVITKKLFRKSLLTQTDLAVKKTVKKYGYKSITR